MDEDELRIRNAIKPKVEEAREKFNASTNIEFIIWLNDTFVPDEDRIPVPLDDTRTNEKKMSRWFVGKIFRHLHPDKHISTDRYKYIYMTEITALANKVNNKLKGVH